MIEKVEAYRAGDGKIFPTLDGAKKHSKRLIIIGVISSLKMSKSEIQESLELIAESSPKVKELLRNESDWTKWLNEDIESITPSTVRFTTNK